LTRRKAAKIKAAKMATNVDGDIVGAKKIVTFHTYTEQTTSSGNNDTIPATQMMRLVHQVVQKIEARTSLYMADGKHSVVSNEKWKV
jgi:predicted phage-related endonuclease